MADAETERTRRDFVAQLFALHSASIQGFLHRWVRSDDAADLTQEAYYRLLRHAGTLRQGSAARGLLFRTATNLARDHHRRLLAHRADQHIEIEAQEIASDDLGPDDLIAQEQTLAALEHAMAELPPDMRMVLSLRLSEELSYGQIGRALNLSTRTVSRRMADALERLAVVRDCA
jgi:RNA polymerase sigma-70 factor (ECF subfamily)